MDNFNNELNFLKYLYTDMLEGLVSFRQKSHSMNREQSAHITLPHNLNENIMISGTCAIKGTGNLYSADFSVEGLGI